MRRGSNILLALLLFATPAGASVSQPGKTATLVVNRDGRFFFDHTGARDTMPSCAIYRRWVLNASTPAGQAMMSLILTANAQGRSVQVFGTGGCEEWRDTEGIAHIQVMD